MSCPDFADFRFSELRLGRPRFLRFLITCVFINKLFAASGWQHQHVAFRAHSVFGSGGPRETLFELVDPPIERVQLSCAAAPEAAARAIAETLTIAEFDARTQALSVSNGPAQSALRNWLSISPSIGAEVRLEVNWNGRTFDLGPGKIADSSDQISPRIRQWAMPIVLRPSLEQRRAAVSEASSEHAELVITLVPMTNEQLVAWLVRAAGEDGRIPKKEYLDREVSVCVPLRLVTTENEARCWGSQIP